MRVGIPYQVLPQSVYVFRDHRVLDQLHRGFHLLGITLTHGNLFFHAVPVSQPGLAADVPIADGIYISPAALMFNLVWIRGFDA